MLVSIVRGCPRQPHRPGCGKQGTRKRKAHSKALAPPNDEPSCQARMKPEGEWKAPCAQVTQMPEVVGGLTRVADLIRYIQGGHDWHNHTLILVAHWVGGGWSNAEILLTSSALTLPGWTPAQTIDEMRIMIDTARRKWNIPDPSPNVADVDWPPPVDLFSDDDAPSPTQQRG